MNLKEFEDSVKEICAGMDEEQLERALIALAGKIRERDRKEALECLKDADAAEREEEKIRARIRRFEKDMHRVDEGDIRVMYEYYEDWGDPEAYMDGGYVTKYTRTEKAQCVYDTGTALLHACTDRSMYAEASRVYEMMNDAVLICEDQDSGDETGYTFRDLLGGCHDFLTLDRDGIERDMNAVRAHLHA